MVEQRRGRPKSAATALVVGIDAREESEDSGSDTPSGEKRKRQKLSTDPVEAAARSGSDNENDEGKEAKAKAISAQEEAALSSELIAKLLSEDSGGGGGGRMSYYEDYGNGAGAGGYALDEYASGSEPDDDWDPSKKGRRASKGGAKSRKQANSKARPAHGSDSDCSEGDAQDSRRGLKKKHKASAVKKARAVPEPVVPGQFRSGAYTDDEERLFNEGLELFGRSWSEISGHVITRDAKSIRSHAQKYFIKLFRDKMPLPAKVMESGEGYTLSGRPLDPNSAAARPYLQH
ncbi:hypothetical protein GGI21_003258, partial [Coemansia aciculifera]